MANISELTPGIWTGGDLPAAPDAAAGVLLHCHMGINRGPSAAYALLLSLGEDPVDAIDLIRTKRPIAEIGWPHGATRGGSTSSASSARPGPQGQLTIH